LGDVISDKKKQAKEGKFRRNFIEISEIEKLDAIREKIKSGLPQ
jgi:hypothetical protein